MAPGCGPEGLRIGLQGPLVPGHHRLGQFYGSSFRCLEDRVPAVPGGLLPGYLPHPQPLKEFMGSLDWLRTLAPSISSS